MEETFLANERRRHLKTIAKICRILPAIGAFIASLALGGVIVAGVRLLGPWAYPANFGLGMLLCGFVFIVLFPPSRKGLIASKWGRKFALDQGRFEKGFWAKARKRGPFMLVLATNLIAGPFVAALVIRWLGLTEQRSWLYAFTTTLIATAIWVSIYLGAIAWIRSFFASMF